MKLRSVGLVLTIMAMVLVAILLRQSTNQAKPSVTTVKASGEAKPTSSATAQIPATSTKSSSPSAGPSTKPASTGTPSSAPRKSQSAFTSPTTSKPAPTPTQTATPTPSATQPTSTVYAAPTATVKKVVCTSSGGITRFDVTYTLTGGSYIYIATYPIERLTGAPLDIPVIVNAYDGYDPAYAPSVPLLDPSGGYYHPLTLPNVKRAMCA